MSDVDAGRASVEQGREKLQKQNKKRVGLKPLIYLSVGSLSLSCFSRFFFLVSSPLVLNFEHKCDSFQQLA